MAVGHNGGDPKTDDERSAGELMPASIRDDDAKPKRYARWTKIIDVLTLLLLLAAAIGTGLAAHYTGRQAAVAEDTEQRDIRAYVGVNDNGRTPYTLYCAACCVPCNKNEPEGDAPFSIRVHIKNFGKTPGYGQTVCGLLSPDQGKDHDYTADLKSRCPLPSALTNPAMWPGEERDIPIGLADEGSMTLAVLSFLKKEPIYVLSMFEYRDVFNIAHRTYACAKAYIVAGGARFTACERESTPDY